MVMMHVQRMRSNVDAVITASNAVALDAAK